MTEQCVAVANDRFSTPTRCRRSLESACHTAGMNGNSPDDGLAANRALWDARAQAPYGGGEPQREVVANTYADPDLSMTAQEVVQYPHSVGEIVTAAAGSGLIIDRLGEHTEAEFPGSRILPEGPDGTRRFPFGDTYLPILYSLRARSPRAATA